MFHKLHPTSFLDGDDVALVGEVLEAVPAVGPTAEEEAMEEQRKLYVQRMPKLSQIYNLHDFEALARKILTPDAWAYYSGGADDEYTLRENRYAFHQYFFHPKVLVDVRNVDISTTMLGSKLDAPFYCSATALAQLGHPDGELSISKACALENIAQMISSTSSYPLDEILDVGAVGQTHWFQLYVKPDRNYSYEMLKKCEQRNVKGVFVTVDTPVLGRREKDYKFRIGDDGPDEDDAILNYDDPGLTWADIDDFKRRTNLPVVIKGVQRVQDVLLAIEHKCDGVVLSNHGGRQLEFSRPPIEVLADVMAVLKKQNLEKDIEVYIDGGVKRGTDVIKALCLGAKGVGLGRPFLYANSCYGEQGVRKAIRLLKEEIALNMKLLGVTRIEELTSELLEKRQGRFHDDVLYESSYEPLEPAHFTPEK